MALSASQAMVVAYADDFKLMMIVAFVALPLIFLLKRVKARLGVAAILEQILLRALLLGTYLVLIRTGVSYGGCCCPALGDAKRRVLNIRAALATMAEHPPPPNAGL